MRPISAKSSPTHWLPLRAGHAAWRARQGAMTISSCGRTLAFLLLVVAAMAGRASETPYNQGVGAYKQKNHKEALAQWSKAAARGNVHAMNNLGFLLFYGRGTEKNPEDAIRLWRMASYAGHSQAQWHLGTAYESGTGVEKDLAKAYAWYRGSVESATGRMIGENGDAQAAILKDAKASLEKLRSNLSRKELARGKALAAEYLQRYGRPAP